MRSTRKAWGRRTERLQARNPARLPGCATPSAILSESSNPEEFLEHTKLELFPRPGVSASRRRAKLIALPRQANVIDFRLWPCTPMFANSARSACKINGKFAAAVRPNCRTATRSRSLTSQAQSAPPSAWESLAVYRQGEGRRSGAPNAPPRCAINNAGLGRRTRRPPVCPPPKIEYMPDDKLKGALPRLARTLDRRCEWRRSAAANLKASDVARRHVSRLQGRNGWCATGAKEKASPPS